MNLFRRPAAVAVAALALAALPATAEAHDGDHPFKNCTEAYDNGYSNILEGDEHYAERLDRDKDGIGCDQPPAGFVPAEDNTGDEDESAGADESNGTDDTAGDQGTDLAATGGSSATPYLAGGGAAVLLAGGGVLLAARKRRTTR
ncbi:LAETG motif-containing sortase-dependent surface protein [Streptomyces yerevanensis]|uniref:LAETG motif-containing sortase-dependent surface protein n=1 Tax=Streptomyces yerevanensis TaxID=66378 RepID=UPI0005250919|nr:LAETG motif-containing sortase-dependent surface protein [Streptomyces yerevanensis]